MRVFRKRAVPLVSLVIVVILAFQAAATFRVLCPPARLGLPRIACEPATWPFVNYPMYSQPHYAGDQLNRYSVYGLLPDETDVEIRPEHLGITVFQFDSLIAAMLTEDVPQVSTYAAEYEARHQTLLRGMRLENRPLTLLESGWQEDTPQVVVVAFDGEE